MSEVKNPIFVRGLSRSGGTLLVTVLDSHSKISMSYELYEGLLCPKVADSHPEFVAGTRGYDLKVIGQIVKSIIGNSDSEAILDRKLIAALRDGNFSSVATFAARMARGGLLARDAGELIAEFIAAGQSWDTVAERLHFIGLCAARKAEQESSELWGLKCAGELKNYFKVWPEARILNVIRDCRDVYASQLLNGNFNPDPAKVAETWVATHTAFEELATIYSGLTYSLRYEDMVVDPESEISKLCQFLEIDFEPGMLQFFVKKLSIFLNPRGHLSIDRISQPIDTNSVGRYKRELSAHDISTMEQVAGAALEKYGYM